MLVTLLLLVLSLLYYLHFRRTRRPLYELARSLPDVGTLPLLGHTHWFLGGPEKILSNVETLANMLYQAGGVGKVWIGPSLHLVVSNLDDVQKVLETCLDKDSTYRFLRVWLGNGLFVAPVDKWKAYRRLVVPIFNNRVIEEFIEIFGEQGLELIKLLDEKVGQPEFDIYKYITACMLDIVYETSMGERMDVQHSPGTPYLRARHSILSIINMRLFKPWLQPDLLFNLTPYSKIQQDSIQVTRTFTDQVVKKKRKLLEEKGVDADADVAEGRQDFLQLLLTRDTKFNDEQLREHIDSFTIAGNDTTALVIAYTLMLLGRHPVVQDKVYEELKGIFGESLRAPQKADLDKMVYMERVLKEAMRLYTVVPIIGRKTQKEVKLSNCTVPPGVSLVVVPSVIHRSKSIWGPDADTFDPDRFLPENSARRHPCAFIPFSHGTRNCIGRHFGMLVMKSILAIMLRSYEIKSKDCNRFKIEILLFPVFGHLITIERRKRETCQ